MRFFDFLESKFTKHSITQQVRFSAVSDGEQKATQTFLWLIRTVCKWWAMIKLPVEFILCLAGLIAFPEPAVQIAEKLVKEGQERAMKMKSDARVGQEKGLSIAPSLESKPSELQ